MSHSSHSIASYDASGRRSSLGTLPQFRQEGSEPWLRRRSRTRRRCRSNLAARVGCASASCFARHSGRISKSRPLPFCEAQAPFTVRSEPFPHLGVVAFGTGLCPPPFIPSGSSLRASAPPGRGSSFLAAGGSVPISTMLLLKAGWGPTVPIAVAGELHPVPEGPALALPCAPIGRGLRSLRRGALRRVIE